ncbi:MAG: alpha/beta hydrolase [bacterium]
MIRRLILLFLLITFSVIIVLVLVHESDIQKRELQFFNGGLILIGDLYIPKQITSKTGIVFLHGSLPEGRKLLLYKTLCERLASNGYVVFSFDQRGYGDSEDPEKISSVAELDFVSDAEQAVTVFLEQSLKYGVQSVALIGHSFGGGVAVAAGVKSSKVSKIVSISPGRRISSRFFGNNATDDLQYVQERKSNDMRLTEMIPIEVVKPMLDLYNVEQFRGVTFQKPLLLIEGSEEPLEDLAFTKKFVSTLGGPVFHIVINSAAHYFGTRKSKLWKFWRWRVEDRGVINKLVNTIDNWINDTPDSLKIKAKQE